ncbi:MAG: EF-P 5-aminopentanol modification-associated protein YfmH [Clostridia bacterium]
MNKVIDNGLNEKIYFYKLTNGLEVYLHPKKNFHAKSAVFATKYGSNDNHFIGINGEEHKVPEGIAHFLEHKMFDMPDIDVFEEFSKLGVSANAYTNYYMTAYIFSGTENFEKSIELLLDYVQTAHFTDKSVEKEKGIIEQEIKMYDDNPDWRLQLNLLKNMYHNHPVKLDIAGTVDSIYKISKEDLRICYETFYHPSNMILYLAGDFDIDEIYGLIERNQLAKNFVSASDIQRFYPEEPYTVLESEYEEVMSVTMPQLALGLKYSAPKDSREMLVDEIVLKIAFDVIIGNSSSLYNQLYEENLILDDFSFGNSVNKSYAYTILGGATPNPKILKEKLLELLPKAAEKEFTKDNIERVRRKHIGQLIMSSDSLSGISNKYVTYNIKGMELSEYFKILKNLSLDQIKNKFKEIVDFNNYSISEIIQK